MRTERLLRTSTRNALQLDTAAFNAPCFPARLDHRRGVAVGENGRTLDPRAGTQFMRPIEARVAPAGGKLIGQTVHRDCGAGGGLVGRDLMDFFGAGRVPGRGHARRIRTRRDALHGHRFNHQRLARHHEFKPASIAALEFIAQQRDVFRPRGCRQRTRQCRIGTLIADMKPCDATKRGAGQPLGPELCGGLVEQARGQCRRRA